VRLYVFAFLPFVLLTGIEALAYDGNRLPTKEIYAGSQTVQSVPANSRQHEGALSSSGKSESSPAEGDGLLSGKTRIYIKKFRIVGNRIFSEADLSPVISPFEGREITSEELQSLQRDLTLYYVNRGYINSGAIIPDQRVSDGIVTIQVTEGVISAIDVAGTRYFRPDYIRNRLALAVGPPANINEIQQALQLLQQDPRIRRINAELSPGIAPGEGLLKVRVAEERPYRAVLSFANNQSPSVGSYRGEVFLSHMNLFGLGHVLEGKFGISSGSQDVGLSYSVPLTPRDTLLKVYYSNCANTVVEELFKPLDIESKTRTYGVAVIHPLYRTAARQFSLGIAGEIRRDATFLLGQPFSFTDTNDNVTHDTVVRFSQEWVSRSQSQVLAARSVFSIGIDLFGATKNDTGADGRFFSWLGQMQLIRRLSESGVQMVFRTDVQLAANSLLPMERFSVGGMNSVRGYRENQLVRDNGVVSSLELRFPVLRNSQGETIAQFAPFADTGWSWNTKKATPSPVNISGVGAGIRLAVARTVDFIVYGGYALNKVANSGHDLQDEGLHFQITWRAF
jgi:hemolysin activation/secretion protein